MDVDAAQLEAHRATLTGHCYRMLGSPHDAEDELAGDRIAGLNSFLDTAELFPLFSLPLQLPA